MALPLHKLAQSGLGPPGVARHPSPGQGLPLNDKGRIPVHVEAFEVLTADRDNPQDGEHWWRSDLNTLAVREGSTTYRLGEAATTYRKVTATDVVNTITETDLLNGEIEVAAGAMSTNKILRATLAGDALNNSGGATTSTFRIKFGGTVFWADTETLGVSSATRYPWRIVFEIANLDAANAQAMNGFFTVGNATAPTTGIGDVDTANASQTPIGTSADQAIDTASAQALVVTVEHGTASANVSTRLKYALVEVL